MCKKSIKYLDKIVYNRCRKKKGEYMKKIKRILCFGDSNTWGYNGIDESRFDENTRWTRLLQQHLGEDYEIIEEGLPGRTASIDDPIQEGMNAYDYIHPCLKSHSPLDLVIIMLGTNDAKERFNLTSFNIAQGIVRLTHLQALTQDLNVSFLDLKDKVTMAAPDYTHLNKDGHAIVSTIMADKIKSLNI